MKSIVICISAIASVVFVFFVAGGSNSVSMIDHDLKWGYDDMDTASDLEMESDFANTTAKYKQETDFIHDMAWVRGKNAENSNYGIIDTAGIDTVGKTVVPFR